MTIDFCTIHLYAAAKKEANIYPTKSDQSCRGHYRHVTTVDFFCDIYPLFLAAACSCACATGKSTAKVQNVLVSIETWRRVKPQRNGGAFSCCERQGHESTGWLQLCFILGRPSMLPVAFVPAGTCPMKWELLCAIHPTYDEPSSPGL